MKDGLVSQEGGKFNRCAEKNINFISAHIENQDIRRLRWRMRPIQRLSCKRNVFTSSFFIQQKALCASHAERASEAHCIRTMKTTIVYNHVFPGGHSSSLSLAVPLIVLDTHTCDTSCTIPRDDAGGGTQTRRAHEFVIHFKMHNAQIKGFCRGCCVRTALQCCARSRGTVAEVTMAQVTGSDPLTLAIP